MYQWPAGTVQLSDVKSHVFVIRLFWLWKQSQKLFFFFFFSSLECCLLMLELRPPLSRSWKCAWTWRRLWMSWNSSGCKILLSFFFLSIFFLLHSADWLKREFSQAETFSTGGREIIKLLTFINDYHSLLADMRWQLCDFLPLWSIVMPLSAVKYFVWQW